jgi:uncharacterized protein
MKIARTGLTGYGLALLGLVLCVPPAMAASFDCSKARTPYAKAICADPDLSKADDELAQAYRAALAGLSEPAQSSVKADHEAWAKFAAIACTKDARPAIKPYDADGVACLATLFANRTDRLRQDRTIGGLRFYSIDRYAALPDPDPETDGAAIATKEVSTPRIDGEDAEAQTFNRLVDAGIGEDFDTTIADDPQPDDAVEDDENVLAVTHVDPARITLQATTYAYGHGAAHGNGTVGYLHYLRPEKRWLKASDVFAGDDWRTKLQALALAAVEQAEGEELMLDDPHSIDDAVTDPARWDFGRDGLILQFEPYEIAPYAAGSPTVTLPWSDLAGLLAPGSERFAQ